MSHSDQLIMVNIDEDDDDVNENDDDDLCSPRQEIWGWCHHCRPGLDIQTGELSSNTWIICLFTWCLDFLDAQKLFGRPTRQQHCWDSVHGAVFRGHMQLWIHSLHQNRAPFKTKIWVHRPYRVLCSDTCNCGFKICHLKLKLGFQSIQGLKVSRFTFHRGSRSIDLSAARERLARSLRSSGCPVVAIWDFQKWNQNTDTFKILKYSRAHLLNSNSIWLLCKRLPNLVTKIVLHL